MTAIASIKLSDILLLDIPRDLKIEISLYLLFTKKTIQIDIMVNETKRKIPNKMYKVIKELSVKEVVVLSKYIAFVAEILFCLIILLIKFRQL